MVKLFELHIFDVELSMDHHIDITSMCQKKIRDFDSLLSLLRTLGAGFEATTAAATCLKTLPGHKTELKVR